MNTRTKENININKELSDLSVNNTVFNFDYDKNGNEIIKIKNKYTDKRFKSVQVLSFHNTKVYNKVRDIIKSIKDDITYYRDENETGTERNDTIIKLLQELSYYLFNFKEQNKYDEDNKLLPVIWDESRNVYTY